MSAQQNSGHAVTHFSAPRDTIPARRISDNFGSSRSYAPDCKFLYNKN